MWNNRWKHWGRRYHRSRNKIWHSSMGMMTTKVMMRMMMNPTTTMMTTTPSQIITTVTLGGMIPNDQHRWYHRNHYRPWWTCYYHQISHNTIQSLSMPFRGLILPVPWRSGSYTVKRDYWTKPMMPSGRPMHYHDSPYRNVENENHWPYHVYWPK